jgi:hypothetical protein
MFNYNQRRQQCHNLNVNQPFEIEAFYPEVYKELYPFVVQAVDEFMKSGSALTPETLNSIIDNIILNSGLWDEDADAEAGTLSRPMRPRPCNRCRRRHHNRNSLRDILRILFLRDIVR